MTLIWTILIITAVSAYVGAVSTSCTSVEFKCRGKCTELVRCTNAGNNTFNEQVVRKCQGTIGHFCNASSLDCFGESCQDDELDEGKISCHEDGVYPHPVKCNRYYSCNNFILAEFVCAGNSSYNGKLNNCSNQATAHACVTTPIPRCQKVSDIGAYRDNPAVYYVCAYDQFGYLRPELHRCVDGYFFDDDKAICMLPVSSAITASINILLLLVVVLCEFSI